MNNYILYNDYNLTLSVDGLTYCYDDETFIEDLTAQRAVNVYVWGAPVVFGNIDHYVYTHNIPTGEHGKKPTSPTIKRHDAGDAHFMRKLTIATAKAGSGNRHKRLHTVNYYNVQQFFGNLTFEEALKAFNIPDLGDDCFKLGQLINAYEGWLKCLTGLEFFKPNGGLKYYSTGSIAKAYYLSLKYPFSLSPLKAYQLDFPQDENQDIKFRLEKLLPRQVFYMKNGELAHGYKYDINSLFLSEEIKAPALGKPIEITVEEYDKVDRSKWVVICEYQRIVFQAYNTDCLFFQNPFEEFSGKNSAIVDIEQPIAFFEDYLSAIQDFYDIIDVEGIKFYKCRKIKDPDIKTYGEHLYKIKSTENGGMRVISKNLINFLHGKFSQISLNEVYEYIPDEGTGILKKHIAGYEENWEKSHFHFIRGAYIYALAAKRLINDLYLLSKYFSLSRIWYIDTDCLITDIEPQEFSKILPLSSTSLGAYKLEEEFTNFKVLAAKNYIRIVDDKIKLTAGGNNADEIIKKALSVSIHTTVSEGIKFNIPMAYDYICSGKLEYVRFILKRNIRGIKLEPVTLKYEFKRNDFDGEDDINV